MRSLSLRAAGIVAAIAVAHPPGSWAQSAPGARPEFEVASVRPITERGSLIQSQPGKLLANISGNRFTLRIATVPSLIMDAYNVRADQSDQARLMLQTLLADRFQLRLHHETEASRVRADDRKERA
jgi:Protein of unknown function (DUF3738)